MILPAVIAAVFALGLNLLVIPSILRMAHRFKWYDLPNKRKIHTGLIPRLGGPGMYVVFLCSALVTPPLVTLLTRGTITLRLGLRFIPFFLGISLIHAVGLIDDFRPVKALLKFFLQVLAAVIVTAGGFLIRSITIPYVGPVRLGLFAYPLTVFWIVGISNAINLIDGMERILCPRVHLKAVVIDGSFAYTGSANLTGAGMGAKSEHKRNFESGIITDDQTIVAKVMEQFDNIWRGTYCPPCKRKKFCADYKDILA